MTIRKCYVHLCLLCTIAVFAVHCTKSHRKPEIPPPSERQKLVKKISASAADYFAYTYTDDKHVRSQTSSFVHTPNNDIRIITVNYTYENGKLKEGQLMGALQEFIHGTHFLERSVHYYSNGSLMAQNRYTYDQYKRLIQVDEIPHNPIDVEVTRLALTYYADGNLEKMVNSFKRVNNQNFEVSSTQIFDNYDKKIHPVPDNIWGIYLPDLKLHKNNPGRLRLILPNGNVERTTNMTYEYDQDQHPTKQTQVTTVNGVVQPAITFAYEYY